MKSFFKKILVAILGWQVKRLRKRHSFKIIGVVGSIGKTSTKIAIAEILQGKLKVRYQRGNYNDIVSVPLVFFGHEMPSLWNIPAWLKILILDELQIFGKFSFDVVVVELGTDAPGQIEAFRKYLYLDIAVLTAVTPEHMEFFGSIENVAQEEWSVSFFSDIIFANKDLCQFIPENINYQKIIFYGKDYGSTYKIENVKRDENGFVFDITYGREKVMRVFYNAFSEVELYSIDAAVALAKELKIPDKDIERSIDNIEKIAGRMQKFKGIKNSVIIDDSYNASPVAVKIALDSLYNFKASQRIAILGMMNELGKASKEEHENIGRHCDPNFLDLVVTIGKDANSFLAPAARKKGCKVYEARNSVDAGFFVKNKMKEGAAILVKGSQNDVFAEEAIKPLLADKSDASKLVRQERKWMAKKR